MALSIFMQGPFVPHLHASSLHWNQCEVRMHRGVTDAGSLTLYCCILFFICLTIFSGTLLKWKHFIAKINLCCYFCISSRKNNVAKIYIVQYKIIIYIYFANKWNRLRRKKHICYSTNLQQNPLLNLAVLFLQVCRFASVFY